MERDWEGAGCALSTSSRLGTCSSAFTLQLSWNDTGAKHGAGTWLLSPKGLTGSSIADLLLGCEASLSLYCAGREAAEQSTCLAAVEAPKKGNWDATACFAVHAALMLREWSHGVPSDDSLRVPSDSNVSCCSLCLQTLVYSLVGWGLLPFMI